MAENPCPRPRARTRPIACSSTRATSSSGSATGCARTRAPSEPFSTVRASGQIDSEDGGVFPTADGEGRDPEAAGFWVKGCVSRGKPPAEGGPKLNRALDLEGARVQARELGAHEPDPVVGHGDRREVRDPLAGDLFRVSVDPDGEWDVALGRSDPDGVVTDRERRRYSVPPMWGSSSRSGVAAISFVRGSIRWSETRRTTRP
jgi:hypothetical protein